MISQGLCHSQSHLCRRWGRTWWSEAIQAFVTTHKWWTWVWSHVPTTAVWPMPQLQAQCHQVQAPPNMGETPPFSSPLLFYSPSCTLCYVSSSFKKFWGRRKEIPPKIEARRRFLKSCLSARQTAYRTWIIAPSEGFFLVLLKCVVSSLGVEIQSHQNVKKRMGIWKTCLPRLATTKSI